jgi:hypothetical protein
VVERLRQDGHDVVYVAELSPSVGDEEVLQQTNARSAVLLTADKDFGPAGPRARWNSPASPRRVGERDEGGDRRRGVSEPRGGTDWGVQRRRAWPSPYSTKGVTICEGRTSGCSRRPAAAADAACSASGPSRSS